MTDLSASNPNAAMIRVEPKNASRYAGQRRHDLRIGHQPGYVDADRAHLNRVLVAPPTAANLRSVCEGRRAQRDTRRAMKANASVGMVGLIGFGTEAQVLFSALPVPVQDRALKLAARLAARRMGTTVAGLVFHGDETAPHAHVTFPAYDRTGQPLTETVGRAVLKGLQDDMAAAFSRYAPGIERGRSRMDRLAAGADYADTVNRSVRELHRDLPAEIAAKRFEAEAAGVTLAQAQARVDEMQARVEKLNAKVDLSEKEAKRLSTYEKRLADRVTELEHANAAAEAARIEADRLADLAEQKRFDAEAEAIRLKAEAVEAADLILAEKIAEAENESAALRAKAAAEARQHAAAFAALANEIEAGTLSYDKDGVAVAADIKALEAGSPYIDPAIHAALKASDTITARMADADAHLAAAKEQRQQAIFARADAEEAKLEAADLLNRLRTLIGRVKAWLSRPDLPDEARADADRLSKDVMEILSPEESSEEPDRGPGL